MFFRLFFFILFLLSISACSDVNISADSERIKQCKASTLDSCSELGVEHVRLVDESNMEDLFDVLPRAIKGCAIGIYDSCRAVYIGYAKINFFISELNKDWNSIRGSRKIESLNERYSEISVSDSLLEFCGQQNAFACYYYARIERSLSSYEKSCELGLSEACIAVGEFWESDSKNSSLNFESLDRAIDFYTMGCEVNHRHLNIDQKYTVERACDNSTSLTLVRSTQIQKIEAAWESEWGVKIGYIQNEINKLERSLESPFQNDNPQLDYLKKMCDRPELELNLLAITDPISRDRVLQNAKKDRCVRYNSALLEFEEKVKKWEVWKVSQSHKLNDLKTIRAKLEADKEASKPNF